MKNIQLFLLTAFVFCSFNLFAETKEEKNNSKNEIDINELTKKMKDKDFPKVLKWYTESFFKQIPLDQATKWLNNEEGTFKGVDIRDELNKFKAIYNLIQKYDNYNKTNELFGVGANYSQKFTSSNLPYDDPFIDEYSKKRDELRDIIKQIFELNGADYKVFLDYVDSCNFELQIEIIRSYVYIYAFKGNNFNPQLISNFLIKCSDHLITDNYTKSYKKRVLSLFMGVWTLAAKDIRIFSNVPHEKLLKLSALLENCSMNKDMLNIKLELFIDYYINHYQEKEIEKIISIASDIYPDDIYIKMPENYNEVSELPLAIQCIIFHIFLTNPEQREKYPIILFALGDMDFFTEAYFWSELLL